MKLLHKPVSISVSILFFMFFANASAHENDMNLDPTLACKEKNHDDYCEFYNHDEDKYRGICRIVIEELTCVRNQPIEHAVDNDETDGVHSHDNQTEHTVDSNKEHHCH